MGAIGGVLRAVQGDDKYRTVANVKSPEIARRISTGLGDYDTTRALAEQATADYLRQFQGLTPQALAQATQESDVVSSVYDDRVANQLATLRRKRFEAQQKGVELALQNARQQTNAARLLQGGGDSSYARRLGLDLANRINAQALLGDADQERLDFSNLLQNRLGLAGRRTGLMDSVAARELRPIDLARANQAANLSTLGGLTQLDQANTFYGIQKERSGLDRWAEAADALDQGIMNAASVFGSVMGGMTGMGGGGAAPQLSKPNPTASFGPTNSASGFNLGLGDPAKLGNYSFGGLGSYGQNTFNPSMSF